MNWYKIENKADRAEIWIYEQIGEDWWTGEGVTAKQFQKDLSAIKASQIDLHINSIGGNVQDGVTIYNLLKQHPANITTYIDGWAASIASVIALAGDRVVMAENGIFMIHKPAAGLCGYYKATELNEIVSTLDVVQSSIVKAYMRKTGKTEDEINLMLEPDNWMASDAALEAGFVDEISEPMDLAACAGFGDKISKHGIKVPENMGSNGKPSPKNLERALRDAGCSRSQAKSILASGYRDCRDDDPPQRDVEPQPTAKKDRVADLLLRAAIGSST